MGRRDGVAVGLDVATRVVRVDVENIRAPSTHLVTLLVPSCYRRSGVVGTSLLAGDMREDGR